MYITEEKREQLKPIIQELIAKFGEFQLDDVNDDIDANVEFVVASIITTLYAGDEARLALGVLNNVSQEYARRIAAPYHVQQSFDLGETFDPPAVRIVELHELKVGGSE